MLRVQTETSTTCSRSSHTRSSFFFFFNDTATTEIYTLSLHDALPIYYLRELATEQRLIASATTEVGVGGDLRTRDRKSTRLNSSHTVISYAVFCLKKKTKAVKLLCGKESVIQVPADNLVVWLPILILS